MSTERGKRLDDLLRRGRGSDFWFHRSRWDFETRLGYFRTQVVNNRWWVIDPEGKPWISLGVNHISFEGSRPVTIEADSDPNGRSPYKESVRRRYGDANSWALYQGRRLRRWGFNTVGCWSSLEMFAQGLPYTVMLGMARRLMPDMWLHELFPDVFSSDFEQVADQVACEECSPRKEDPLLLGYFTDNEFNWKGDRLGLSMFDHFMSLDATAPGKKALIEHVSNRYAGDVGSFERAWNISIVSFEDLNKIKKLLPGPEADEMKVEEDKNEFLSLTAERYFSVCETSIRKADPNHMILGCRFTTSHPSTVVVEACGRHADIISINSYGHHVPAEYLQDVFDATWRPIMITEWSFKAMDSGLPNTKGGAIPVATQTDRADGYERFINEALKLPFVVGLHWFEYVDQPLLGRQLDGENSNYGLVDVEDEPYCTLVERMRVVNGQAMVIAASAGRGLKASRSDQPVNTR